MGTERVVGAGEDAGLAGYEQYEPSVALRPFVRRFLHGYTRDDRPHRLTIPPSGGMFLSYVDDSPLLVHFSDRSYIGRPRLFVGGQLRREAPELESEGRFGLIGTEFTPTGFHRLFGVDAEPFTDEITDVHELWPDEAAALAAELAAQPDVPARVAALDRALCARLDDAVPVPLVEEAVERIQAERGLIRVEQLAEAIDVHPRTLHRQFLQVVGVGPKHFAKVVQLNAVVAGLQELDPGSLGTFALDCGYYDQAHFIHDFQRYVGANPIDFLRAEDPFLRTYLGRVR